MAGIEAKITADVQGAVVPLKQLQDELKNLKTSLKAASDPTEIGKLSSAIVDQKNKIQQSLAATNAFATSTFGVSRATRLAHADLEATTRSLEQFTQGGERSIDSLTNLLFTFERLKGSTGSMSGAFAALGETLLSPAGIFIGLSAISTLLAPLIGKMFGFGEEVKKTDKKLDEAKKSAENYKNAVDNIFKSSATEAAEVGSLIAVLKSETETRERKLAAIKKLNEIAPETFNNLKLEGNAVLNLDEDYKTYLKSLSTVIAAKIKQVQLEELIKKQLELQGTTLTTSGKQQIDNFNKIGDKLAQIAGTTQKLQSLRLDQAFDTKDKAKKLQEDIDGLLNDLKELSKGVKLKVDVPKEVKVKLTTEGEIDNEKLAKQIKDTTEAGPINKLTVPIHFTPIPLLDGKQKTPSELFDEVFKLSLNKAKTFKEKLEVGVSFGKITESTKEAALAIDSFLTPAFQNLFDAIEHGMNPLKAFFESLKQSVEQLIAKIIQAVIESALLSLIPGAGTFGAIFGSIFHPFASGGIVSGATLAVVGERSSASNPEVIAPLDQLRGMIGGVGNNVNVQVQGVIRGNDLLLIKARSERSQGRAF